MKWVKIGFVLVKWVELFLKNIFVFETFFGKYFLWNFFLNFFKNYEIKICKKNSKIFFEKKVSKKIVKKNCWKKYFWKKLCEKIFPKKFIFRKKFPGKNFCEKIFTNIDWSKFKWVEIGREWNFLTIVGWSGLK